MGVWMMSRYLVVNADGFVTNIILWDGISSYDAGGDLLLPAEEHPDITFGYQLIDDVWVEPTVTEAVNIFLEQS
jgi:hypothetical protein